MITYIAFQVFYAENEITEKWAIDWGRGTAHIHKLRRNTLKRLKQ